MGSSSSRVILAKKDLDAKILLITQKQTEINEKIKHHGNQALYFKNKSERAQALMHLRLCRSNKATLEKLIIMKGNLINIKDNLDTSELMGDVIKSMKNSLEILSTLAKGQDVETVNDLMDGFNDLSQHADEVGRAMSQDINNSGEYDLEEEYKKIEAEVLQEQLPSVEDQDIVIKKEERQLSALLE